MKFILKPSLQHIALVNIAVTLWKQNDVMALISELSSTDLYFSAKWEVIEEKVIKKVPNLSLPELLEEKVLGFVKSIGLQIKGWMKFHYTRFQLVINLPADLFWTPQGTIDRKKTAEMLVNDENLDMSTRYKLACIYCFKDDIIQFWNNMPEDIKESVSHEFPIIIFWSRYMRRRGSHIDYISEFDECAGWGNKVAAEYFLEKLTPPEKKEALAMAAKHAEDPDVLCFLISEMDEEQQIKVFRHRPYRVLKSFLQWPMQSFFIKITSFMWNFLSKNDYDNILKDIVMKTINDYKDWNYQMLFREFWWESPNTLKSLIVNEIDKSWLLPFLFRIKEKASIRLILNDATITVKEKLIFNDEINNVFEHSIRNNEWDLFEFYVRECLPSKTTILKFKEIFEKRIMWDNVEDNIVKNKEKWDLLFHFSDDSICKYNNRSEEGESSLSKQF